MTREIPSLKKIMALSFVILSLTGFGDVKYIYTNKDTEAFQKIINFSDKRDLKRRDTNTVILEIATYLLGTRYKDKPLNENTEGKIYSSLTSFDCVTYLENVLALTTCIKTGKDSFDDYCENLLKMRYRDTNQVRFDSRFHYFSDWIKQKENEGAISLVIDRKYGAPYSRKVNFITTHREKYDQLKDNQLYISMMAVEKRLSGYSFYYIPKNRLKKIEKSIIKAGDIIAITSNEPGMDISHVGIAVYRNGRVYIMHASSTNRKVMVSQKPLQEYMETKWKQSGVIIARFTSL